MKMRLLLLTILGVITVAGLLTFEACKTRAAQCPLCSRDIHSHMQVSIRHNHLPMKTCCMACALTFRAQEKNVEIESATDFMTNNPVDPQKAFYVVDSDVSPCIQDMKVNKVLREPHDAMYACYDRCSPGILAFGNRNDAETFRKEHGGEMTTFVELEQRFASSGGRHHD